MNVFISDLLKIKSIIKFGCMLFYQSYTRMSLILLMMLTIGSFISAELPRSLSLKTIARLLRLLTTFTKNILNILATSLLREIILSFWVSVILLRLLEILFARKGFAVFQKFLLSVMLLVSKFSKKLFFSFQKKLAQ